MIRVGIIISEDLSPEKNKKTSWLGGLNYYKNVISAVYKLPNRAIEIVVFVNSDASPQFVSLFSGAEIVRSSIVDFLKDSNGSMKFKKPLKKIWLYLLSKFKGSDVLLEELFLKHRIDVACYGDPFVSKYIKSVCWVPDFQQINHPEFFSQEENVESRNKHINWLIEKSDSLILSSETALSDLKRFNPGFAVKARVLKFIPAIDLKLKVVPIEELGRKYRFTGDYFYMPNQFWKHKNHHVVIRALNQVVNANNKNILVLASGSLTDHRNTSYITELNAEINQYGLEDNIKFLGVIPYLDVLSLMHFSLALINPSFSEGWSSTVEEAKQLKIPLILSNIDIHKEQTLNVSNSILFDPKDDLTLANILMNFERKESYNSDFNYHKDFAAKQIQFGTTYQDIILEVKN